MNNFSRDSKGGGKNSLFKITKSIAAAEFVLSADGPVLVSGKSGREVDPTLPKEAFVVGDTENGEAYVIPGSTVKGVIRSRFTDLYGEDKAKELFGCIGKGATHRSKLSFNDAYADMETVKTSVRYFTAINSASQSAKTGSFRDVEAVERGDFYAGFKAVNCSGKDIYELLIVLNDVNNGFVTFGGKKSRGFGTMKITSFKLTINKGYDENFVKVEEKTFNSLEEAITIYKENVND